jgi:hypothetical protein
MAAAVIRGVVGTTRYKIREVRGKGSIQGGWEVNLDKTRMFMIHSRLTVNC